MDEKPKISLAISKDEALVLFEFLSRFFEKEHPEIIIDQAEKKPLLTILGCLERELVEPFLPNYIEILQASRNAIRDEEF